MVKRMEGWKKWERGGQEREKAKQSCVGQEKKAKHAADAPFWGTLHYGAERGGRLRRTRFKLPGEKVGKDEKKEKRERGLRSTLQVLLLRSLLAVCDENGKREGTRKKRRGTQRF